MKRNHSELIAPISSIRKRSGTDNGGWNLVANSILKKPPKLMSIHDRGVTVDFDSSHVLLSGVKKSILSDIDSQLKEQVTKTLAFMNRLKTLGIDIMSLPDEQLLDLTMSGQGEEQYLNTSKSRDLHGKSHHEAMNHESKDKLKDLHRADFEGQDLITRTQVFEEAIEIVGRELEDLKQTNSKLEEDLQEKQETLANLMDRLKELSQSLLEHDCDLRVMESEIAWYENEVKSYESFNREKEKEIQQKMNKINEARLHYEQTLTSLNESTSGKADDLLSAIEKNLEKKMKIDEREQWRRLLDKQLKEHQSLGDEYKKKLDALQSSYERDHEHYQSLIKQKIREEDRYFAYRVKEDFLKEAMACAAANLSNTEAVNIISMDNVLHKILQKIENFEHREGFLSTISPEQKSQLSESNSLQLELKEFEYREPLLKELELKELISGVAKEAFENQSQALQGMLELRLKAMAPEPASEQAERILEKLGELQEALNAQQQRLSVSRLEVPALDFNDSRSIFDRKRYLNPEASPQQISLPIPSPVPHKHRLIKRGSLCLPNSSAKPADLDQGNNTIDDMGSKDEENSESEESEVRLKSPRQLAVNTNVFRISIEGTSPPPPDLKKRSQHSPQTPNLDLLDVRRPASQAPPQTAPTPTPKASVLDKAVNTELPDCSPERKRPSTLDTGTQTSSREPGHDARNQEPGPVDKKQLETTNASLSRVLYEVDSETTIYQTIWQMLRLSSIFSNTIAKLVIRSQQTHLKHLINE